MSAVMENLLKMFKSAHEAANESSGTTLLTAKVEAILVCSTVLMAEVDDLRYVS